MHRALALAHVVQAFGPLLVDSMAAGAGCWWLVSIVGGRLSHASKSGRYRGMWKDGISLVFFFFYTGYEMPDPDAGSL
jgi:hypothetical protein